MQHPWVLIDIDDAGCPMLNSPVVLHDPVALAFVRLVRLSVGHDDPPLNRVTTQPLVVGQFAFSDIDDLGREISRWTIRHRDDREVPLDRSHELQRSATALPAREWKFLDADVFKSVIEHLLLQEFRALSLRFRASKAMTDVVAQLAQDGHRLIGCPDICQNLLLNRSKVVRHVVSSLVYRFSHRTDVFLVVTGPTRRIARHHTQRKARRDTPSLQSLTTARLRLFRGETAGFLGPREQVVRLQLLPYFILAAPLGREVVCLSHRQGEASDDDC